MIRAAQAAAAAGRLMQQGGPDYVVPHNQVPDVRRLIRDAFRE